ncbi:Phthiocerol synthesis polyketide synthase type I PpsC [Streptomyces davaonensis JCM 4913]|uniref:Phthiocerol synthesis polyketide synthase type I PpsC n=1 Tax=Streptomyces davaonensis (strain DSM 101723 / JCM 4913 / KCC S-0913 / 768) TaxID=1214101 RepID=K4R0A3_STRDJ|nr:type I polyketide synthase [Streptomyces davaonensis]CCK26520.1 Phthiocerol synthesis polyketide synthase type I PpsC [Streptomyces davaonensis JCM 4913]
MQQGDRRAVLQRALDTIDQLERRALAAEGRLTEPVAVIGVGCRLPGGVDGPEDYWRLLAEGRDAVVEVPAARWNAADFLCDDFTVPGTIRSASGGFLTHWEPDTFDAAFFGISPREAAAMDPQQRLLMEVTWEALEHAGLPADRLHGQRGGVFVGITLHEYGIRHFGALAPQDVDAYTVTGSVHNVAAGRIAYQLGLQGPAMAVDTACSSSLTAVHLACQSLRTGDADLALAAGTNLMLMPESSISLSRFGTLAPDGRCKAYDASADGLGRGEGCGVVVLKRLADAARDGDRVLAVLRGTVVNQDGASSGLTVPNGLAQRAAIRKALERSGLTPHDIDYIEGHGTGTPLGDPIELEALADVFGPGRDPDRPLVVGSVKTNIGHTEATAGVAGLIKTVLALRHRHIPAHLHLARRTPRISERAARLAFAGDGVPWPERGRPGRAGVSAFGISGTNAHVVVEEAPASEEARSAEREGPWLFQLSGADDRGLRAGAERLADWLTHHPDAVLPDLAHTLGRRRTHRDVRAALVADTADGLRQGLSALAADESAGTRVLPSAGAGAVWVFSGQGSQWTGMGRELLYGEPEFAAVIDAIEPVVRAESGIGLRELITGRDLGDAPMQHVQPAVFALQVGLAAVWRSRGLEPAAVLGHSMGEAAAAVVSGALSPEDGARVICRRSRLFGERSGGGMIALVELPADEVEERLAAVSGVTVAVSASPRSTVVGGVAEDVMPLVEQWRSEGLLARPVPGVTVAAHTPHVDPLLPELRALLGDLNPAEHAVTFYSTALPDPHTTAACDADYWVANMRNPVRFAQTIAAAAGDGFRVFVEVSPHPVVTHSIGETLGAEGVGDHLVTGSLRRGEPTRTALLSALGLLHAHGITVDLERLHPYGELADLPTTAWQRERYWYDTGAEAGPSEPGTHPLLGSRVVVPGSPVQHVWQTPLSERRLPWLADHRVAGSVVVPGTAYCEAALAAASEALDAAPDDIELHDIAYRTLLVVDGTVTVSTVLTEEGPGVGRIEIRTRDHTGAWVTHAEAVAKVAAEAPRPPARDLPALEAEHRVPLEPETLYAWMRAAGQQHGPAFQGVTSVRLAEGRSEAAVGRIAVPEQAGVGLRRPLLHPVRLDLCMQLLGAVPAASDPGASRALLPVGVRSLRRWADPATGSLVRSRLSRGADGGGLLGDVELLDDEGRVLVSARGVEVLDVSRAPDRHPLDDRLYEQTWEPAPALTPDSPSAAGGWLLVTEPGGIPQAERLRTALTAAGGQCVLLDLDAGAAALTGAVAAAAPRGVVVLMPPDDEETDPAETAQRRTLRLTELVNGLDAALEASGTPERPRLWLVTHGANAVRPDEPVTLAQTAVRGFARTLGFEHPALRTTLLDLDPRGGDPGSVLQELLGDPGEDDIAHRDRQRHLARFVPAPLSDPARPPARRTARYGEDGFRLVTRRAGRLDALELRAFDRRPPGPGEVEIEVRAAGLNFSDTLKAMGVYAGQGDGDQPLGTECAGRISAVGPDVAGFAVGNLVVASGWGCFASYVTTAARLVTRLPEGMTPVQAATVPSVFVTAWYGLRHLARLTAGEHVLVHSATGGVGMAALAIARAAGAEIHATAGTPAKRRLLRDMGIRHVSDSRSLDWADEVLAATDGRGVDVVLNSLTGPALRRGVEVLAEHGRFVEIGKRDLHDDMRLGLLPFTRALTFASVDADLLARTRPVLMRQLLDEVFAEFAAGRLAPLPHTTWPLDRAADAFRTMAGAEHTGKLVITVPESGETEVTVADAVPVIRPYGGYIVTGGLSGLGLHTAGHLAGLGARRLVLNGRSAPSPEAEKAIERMREAGAEVLVVRGDIAEQDTARRLVEAAGAPGATLRGVLHAAVVLDDGVLAGLDAARLEKVWRAKALGAWRLHEATEGCELDWWVAYSSTAAVFGNAGQAGYAAAGSWLDGLVHRRRARGLPALSVNWGPWARIGLAQELGERGYRLIEPEDGMAALEALISGRRTQTAFVSFDPDEWFKDQPAVRDSSLFDRLRAPAESDGPTAAPLLTRVTEASPDRARRILAGYVVEQVCGVLGRSEGAVDERAPMSSLGLDSLMALELRNRLEGGTGLKLSAALVWAHGDLASLAAELAVRLGVAPAAEAAGRPEPEGVAEGDLAAADDETDAQLLAEILAAAESGDATATGTDAEEDQR